MASASTQGTPPWLLRLEQAREQLKDDNYITWLLTKGKEHGIPDDIIDAAAACWTAIRIHKGDAIRLPTLPERDANSLLMENWV